VVIVDRPPFNSGPEKVVGTEVGLGAPAGNLQNALSGVTDIVRELVEGAESLLRLWSEVPTA